MIYIKPPNLSYTDMAIWIDNNYYLESCDDSKLYEYLYHLLIMIAREHAYFKSNSDYDNYGIQGASKLFIRLKDPRQFCDPPKLTPIKSILNYIKSISYPYKIDFESDKFIETPKDTVLIHSDSCAISNYISDESDIFDRIEFEAALDDIPHIIHRYVNKLIVLKDKSDLKNIYISCLLTFIDMIALTEKERSYALAVPDNSSHIIANLYKKNLYRDPILYHLPAEMSNYIKVIVRELQHVVAKELSFKTSSKISAALSIKNLLAANLEE